MIEWRDENDILEDDGRMVTNQVIKKFGNDEELFEEKITYLKHRKRSRV